MYASLSFPLASRRTSWPTLSTIALLPSWPGSVPTVACCFRLKPADLAASRLRTKTWTTFVSNVKFAAVLPQVTIDGGFFVVAIARSQDSAQGHVDGTTRQRKVNGISPARGRLIRSRSRHQRCSKVTSKVTINLTNNVIVDLVRLGERIRTSLTLCGPGRCQVG